jgi:hypothetical protein
MKRLVIAALVLALVGAFAFADGTASWAIKTWTGLGIFSSSVSGSSPVAFPYDYDWVGAGAVRFGFKYTSADGNAGFNSRIQADPRDIVAAGPTGFPPFVGGSPAIFNQLNAWGKLFDGMVTVRAGIGDDYTIATADWYAFGNTDGAYGIYLDVAPVAGLDIGYFQPIPHGFLTGVSTLGGLSEGVIVGAAYSIKDIANIQLGAKLSETKTATAGTYVYFGAKVTAIKELTAILEGKAVLADGATPITLLENLGYTMGALTIGARIGEKMDSNAATTFQWGAEPIITYKVGDNLALNVIVNIYNDAGQTWMSPLDAGVGIAGGTSGDTNFGAGAFVTWSQSGFRVTVGDYYAAATAPAGGNLIFVNADVSL